MSHIEKRKNLIFLPPVKPVHAEDGPFKYGFARGWNAYHDALLSRTGASINYQTTILQAAGAMRIVRCHDGSGDPFSVYDKAISDRIVYSLSQRLEKFRVALDEISNIPNGYGPDSSATNIANDALFYDDEEQKK